MRRAISAHLRPARIGRVPAAILLSGLALLVALPANAQSIDALDAARRCQPQAGKSSPVEEGQILFQAESLTYETSAKRVIAEGRVEASYHGCILIADRIIYDQAGDKVIAEGEVAVMEPSGYVVFADRLELSNGLEVGVVEHFSSVLQGDTRMAAAKAERKPGKITVMERFVYSPCRVCEGEGYDPLWQVKAVRVTHNEGRKTISYRHARVEVKGVPVAYVPYFQHADPSVERKTGLLVPSFGNSTDLGNYAEIPFYWARAPHTDLTISPLITSEEGTVLKGEYRRRTKSGRYTLDGSFTYVDVRAADGTFEETETFRSHLFTDGKFRLSDVWTWGFNTKLTSDDTYLERYEISDLDRLTSHVFAEGFAGRDYLGINGFYFQGLREEDDPGRTPLILPLMELVWYPRERPFGGTVRVDGNVLALRRSDGADSQRLSLSGRWERPLIHESGQVFTGFAEARGDLYFTNDVNPGGDPTLPDDSQVIARALPTIGAEWRWPFARTGERFYQVIEPIAQVIVSPYGGNPDDIPNEDSASFEFDDTNLFTTNKLPGLDLWESGPRANVGIRYGIFGPGGGQVEVVFGQNFRLKEDAVFESSTGLGDQQSDYVGRITFAPVRYVDLTHRFRIDKSNYDFSRNEVSASFGVRDYWSKFSYLKLSEELSESGIEEREEISAEARIKIWGNWFFEGRARRDLDNDKMITSGAALVFENECTELKLQFKRRFTRDRDIEPSSTFNIRLRLRTIGETSSR